jgi:hypothetical protein
MAGGQDSDELADAPAVSSPDWDEEAADGFLHQDSDEEAVSAGHQDSVWEAVGGCRSLPQEARADFLPANHPQALDAFAESEGSVEPPRSQRKKDTVQTSGIWSFEAASILPRLKTQ